MLLSFLLIASSGSAPKTGSSHLMNTVRFKFQSEVCDLKSEINSRSSSLLGFVAMFTRRSGFAQAGALLFVALRSVKDRSLNYALGVMVLKRFSLRSLGVVGRAAP